MNILVTGGTGVVGSEVVKLLTGGTHAVKVLTRDPAKAASLPTGVEGVVGDLGKPETVRRVFEGIDAVFLVNTVTPSEASEGLMAMSAIRRTSVKRLVYLSVHHADTAAWLPHFGAKVGIEEALRRAGVPFTILRPNNFHQNDHFFKDVILQYGIYPQPLGSAGLSRVDVRDIAEAAVAALTNADHEGQTYNLVGPDLQTGESTARIWSEALGRTIRYGGDDLDAWEGQMLQFMPDWLVFDFREMHAFFQEFGLKATPEDIERQTPLIGHAPRSFEAFARETAQAWTAAV